MPFAAPIAQQIWDQKYRLKHFDGTPIDVTVQDTWSRIASALAQAEDDPALWEPRFYSALEDFKFLPAGRIIAGAGADRSVTLFNCFVMGTIPDSMSGIFDMLKEAALTMQQGGGIGYDFSTIRPKGAEVKGVAADASGPLTFMDVWDAMCRTVMSAGSRRGAMMATMRCDHPDIELFIDAKRDPAKLRMFNLSVLVTDEFMDAVKANALWPLMHEVFPGKGRDIGSVVGADGVRRYIYNVVPARSLWEKIMRSTYDYAEPGVIFIDRINSANNLKYIEKIASTNPCAEQPLPPYGACLLGSINLTRFVSNPFTVEASVEWRSLRETVATAVRMMDNVIDVTGFPLPQQQEEAQNKRRIGLGVTGLADMLTMLGLTYGSDDAVKFTEELMQQIAEDSYWASTELAMEKGCFPLFDAEEYLSSDFMLRMDENLRETIREVGIRNSHLTSIAPTGTISLYAGNVSSGIEPIFAYGYTRKVLQPDGSKVEERVRDYAVAGYEKHFYEVVYNPGDFKSSAWSDEYLPATFVTAQDLPPEAHLRMQAAAQRWIDSSISKTINLPREISFEDFEAVYLRAYDLGCKGCTTYRPNDVTGSVLTVEEVKPEPIAVDGDEGGACELRVDPETGQLIKSCE
ncbi:ribonucleotide reductase [Rhodobacter phage RcAquaphina]|nr:ribonucleotide reductase [Rhodobacter phage RcAquaphina]